MKNWIKEISELRFIREVIDLFKFTFCVRETAQAMRDDETQIGKQGILIRDLQEKIKYKNEQINKLKIEKEQDVKELREKINLLQRELHLKKEK